MPDSWYQTQSELQDPCVNSLIGDPQLSRSSSRNNHGACSSNYILRAFSLEPRELLTPTNPPSRSTLVVRANDRVSTQRIRNSTTSSEFQVLLDVGRRMQRALLRLDGPAPRRATASPAAPSTGRRRLARSLARRDLADPIWLAPGMRVRGCRALWSVVHVVIAAFTGECGHTLQVSLGRSGAKPGLVESST